MPLNRRMDKENVLYLHNRVLFASKKDNGIFKFADKWTELEKNILNEVTQTQKDKYSMDALISGYQTQSKG